MVLIPSKLPRHLMVLLVILLCFTQLPPVYSQSDAKTVVNPRFGAVESYYRPDDAVDAGIGWDRIIFEWRYLQPNGPDDWETATWEPYIEAAKTGGREIVGLIKNAPFWATGTKVLGAVPSGINLPLDDPNNQWATFIRKLTKYYSKIGIHHWIIYNEPDIRPKDLPDNFFEFEGDVTQYFKLVKTAYQVAHGNDGEAVIHLAGLNYWIDKGRRRPFYLRYLLQRAFGDAYCRQHDLCFDVLTVHVYGGLSLVTEVVNRYRGFLAEFGFEKKPMWINEMNMRPTLDPGWVYRGKVYQTEPDVTIEDQAAFIIQGIALAMNLGVDRIGIYRLYDNHYSYDDKIASSYEAWGLVRPNGTRRPGYYALQTAARLFRDVKSTKLTTHRGITTVTMDAGDKTIYVVWNETVNEKMVAIPVVGPRTNTLIYADGTTVPLKAQSAVIGDIYEFKLPPCTDPCLVKGNPRIVVQPGSAQTVYLSSAGKLAEIK
ncbi:MAG: hypothetical protein KF716_08385 [Anaerolineae bacterium]|nr:hypothetical protein [Anaerolineae bacterium]